MSAKSRWLPVALALLSASLLVGCSSSLARQVRVEGVEAVRWHGTVGVDLELLVANDARRTLHIEGASLSFYAGSGLLGTVELRGPVEIPRRWRGVLSSRWRFDAPDAAAAYVLQRRLAGGDVSELRVDGEIAVRVGWNRRTISLQKVPCVDFLRIFEPLCVE